MSDAFCVGRYRDEFLRLIRDKTVDIVFANERELHTLYQTGDFDCSLSALKDAKLAVITRSEKGCVVVSGDKAEAVPAAPINKVVDTTGAGDLFAAGFLVGHAGGTITRPPELGAIAAAEVIQHIGARPETSSLKQLAAENGLAV